MSNKNIQKEWWKEAVVYQIYPRSFNDTSGDGNGDLRGIIDKLDYIKNLGIDAIWISPIYASPMADNGYDISDYYSINPMFGSMEDFDELIAEIHKRGMKLMMDLVINHTSIEHPWFLESRSSLDNSKRDWYIWREGKDGREPNNWASHFMNSVWELDGKTNQYYFHMFAREQADLNWNNREVKKEIFSMIEFWLKKGVDAFRMDMANYLMKAKDFPDAPKEEGDNRKYIHGEGLYANQPGMHELIREMKENVLAPYGAALFGETYFLNKDTALDYVAYDRKEFDLIYQYEVVGARGNWEEAKRSVRTWHESFKDRGWNSITLSNHDSPRPISLFGDDGEHREESAKCLATFLLTTPGTPFFLQGEELGMTNVLYQDIDCYSDIEMKEKYKERISKGEFPDDVFRDVAKWSRDNARTPMQWDKNINAGFSTGTPWIGVNQNYDYINTEDEEKDKSSVLNFYKKLIKLRHKHPSLVYGDYVPLVPDNWETYAYKRVLDKSVYVIVINTSERTWKMDPLAEINADSKLLISNYSDSDNSSNGMLLRPWESRVYKVS